MQALYQVEQTGASPETVLDEFVRHRLGAGDIADGAAPTDAVPLFAAVIRGWATRAEALDAAITDALAAGWPMHRIDPVLRAIFRAASSEFFDADGAPAKVVLDEYLDVAHGFFGPEQTRFANGVMDKLARTLRPSEFAVPG